jgi:putative tricarboxylic transport membrane protein
VGGTVSVLLFTFFAPPLAKFALAFGPAEECALVLLAFTTFVGLGDDDVLKTLISIGLGLVLATVGLDLISGQPRLIFGDITGFYHGINFLVLALGVYGIGEMLWTLEATRSGIGLTTPGMMTWRAVVAAFRQLRATLGQMTMGSFLGFFVGLLPAAGATPASLMAYGVARSTSKQGANFGRGELAGVVAPEAANNAASTGSFLPMLTLGIPGSPTTALLLGGMVLWGLVPGPMLFIEQKEFVWGLISSFYTANLLALVVNILLVPVFVYALRIPFPVLSSIILVLCVVGGFAPTQDMHDVWLILIFGIVAYVLRKVDYPMAPMVLALVLGPIFEKSLRQALISARGDPLTFVERPISATLVAVSAVLFLLPLIRALVRGHARRTAPAE